MKFKDTIQNKQNILDKLSRFVKEYSKIKKVAKYIRVKKFKDNTGYIFDTILLDKTRIFLHTSYFKEYKKEYGMIDTVGDKTARFYTCLDDWFKNKHANYLFVETVTKQVFNTEYMPTESDLLKINKMYKELYSEHIKS